MLRLFIGIVRAFIIGDFGRRTVLPGFTELVLAFKNGSLCIELLLSGVGRDMVRVKSWPNLFCGVLYPVAFRFQLDLFDFVQFCRGFSQNELS